MSDVIALHGISVLQAWTDIESEQFSLLNTTEEELDLLVSVAPTICIKTQPACTTSSALRLIIPYLEFEDSDTVRSCAVQVIAKLMFLERLKSPEVRFCVKIHIRGVFLC